MWLPVESPAYDALVECSGDWGPERQVTMADLLPHIPRSDLTFFDYDDVPVADEEVTIEMLRMYPNLKVNLQDPPPMDYMVEDAGIALLETVPGYGHAYA